MSSTLVEQVRAALTAARKDRDKARTLLYSTILSDLGNRDIELGAPVDDAGAVEVIRRAIKRRRESVEHYEKAGRTELAAAETFEITELEQFLPAAVPPGEIRAAVREAIAGGATELGAVMGRVMPRFKGKADGKLINQIVREELAG